MEQIPTHVRFRSHPLCHKAGFTLVELLVVIVIIAALAAVGILATQSVRKKAYQVKSLNTIRQVAAASVAYSAENSGDINVLLDPNDPRQAGGYVTKSYWGRLAPYIFTGVTVANNKASINQLNQSINGLFSTPDAKEMMGTFQHNLKIYSDASTLPVPFTFNKNIYKWDSYLKISAFDPSQTLHFTYGGYRFDEADGASYAPLPKNGAPRTSKIDYFDNRTGVFAFLDGHVEVLTPPIHRRYFTNTP